MKETRPEVELDSVRLVVTIVAEFEIDTWDNGNDIDTAIDEALDSLKGHGSANVLSRKMYGRQKGKKHANMEVPQQ